MDDKDLKGFFIISRCGIIGLSRDKQKLALNDYHIIISFIDNKTPRIRGVYFFT